MVAAGRADGPLRVLWVLDNGAANRLLAAFVDHLPRDEVELEVAVLGEPGPLAAQLAERGVPYHPLGVRDLRNLPVAVLRLRRLLADRRPAVLHAHLFFSGITAELARRTVRPRSRSVFSRHHDLINHLGGHRLHVRLDGWTAGAADRALAVSGAVAATLEREGVDRHRIAVVSNGMAARDLEVDPADAARWRAELGAGTWAVAAGRLDRLKDLPTVVRAVAIARRAHPDLQLAIAGSGPEEVRRSIEDAAAAAGVTGAVRFLGWVDDVLALFASADVFVQGSVTEACPQTVMEAVCLGVPVAVTTVGGTAEIVGGWHPPVPPGDDQALADRLLAVLADPAAARAEATAQADAARARLSAERMVAGTVAVYREALLPAAARAPAGHRLAHLAAAAGWRGSHLVWRLADRLWPTPAAPEVRFGRDLVVPADRSDWISGTAYEGTYERQELGLLRHLVRRGGVAVDVGANRGVYTLRLASLVGPAGRVLAVEAEPGLAAALADLRRRHRLEQVEVHAAAATDDASGPVLLRTPADAVHAGLGTLRTTAIAGADQVAVPALMLDSLLPEGEVDLVKIDVEGCEEQVLRSARGLIGARRVRWLLVEASPEFGSVSELAAEVEAMPGYVVHVVGERGTIRRRLSLEPVEAREIAGLRRQVNLLIGRDDVVRAAAFLRQSRTR